MIRHAKLILATSRPDAVCFLEAKTMNSRNLLKMAGKMGYSCNTTVDPIDFAGGLILV